MRTMIGTVAVAVAVAATVAGCAPAPVAAPAPATVVVDGATVAATADCIRARTSGAVAVALGMAGADSGAVDFAVWTHDVLAGWCAASLDLR